MKRALALVFAFAACTALMITGCAGQGGAATQQGTPDYYDVKVVGSESIVDPYGDSTLVVAFEFTNKTNTPVSFAQAVTTDATQDRTGLYLNERVTSYTGDDGKTLDRDVMVEPGQTGTAHVPFYLISTNEVDVRCAVAFADGGFPNARIILLEDTVQP